MRLLLQPEHAGLAARYFEATRAALRYYGEWFGAYPYGHITVIDPAWQGGAGGMEYPTLFTGGARGWPGRRDVAEGVTVHECGHQFWYAMVGNNEFETRARRGAQHVLDRPDDGPGVQAELRSAAFLRRIRPYVLATSSCRARPARTASTRTGGPRNQTSRRRPRSLLASTGGALSYNKTALWLHTSSGTGWPTLQKILSTFFERWKFRIRSRGFLRRRQRGQRARHDVVLRPGVPQLERVRLRVSDLRSAPVAVRGTSTAAAAAPSTRAIRRIRRCTARRSSCGGT